MDNDGASTSSSSNLAERRQSRLFASQHPPSSSLNARRRSSVLSLQPTSTLSDNPRRRSQLSPLYPTPPSASSSGPRTPSPPPSATSSSTSWEEKQLRRASLAVIGTGEGPQSSSGGTGTGQGKRSSQMMYDEVKGRRGSLMWEEGVKNVRRNSLRQQLEERRSSLLHDPSKAPPQPTSTATRRQSLFVSDDGSSTLSQRRSSLLFEPRNSRTNRESEPMEDMGGHTAVRLAERRRSSLFPGMGMGMEGRQTLGGQGMLGRLSIVITDTIRNSISGGSGYRPKSGAEKEKIEDERRVSYSLNALSQAHLLHHSRASKRTLRRNLLRLTIVILVLVIFSKKVGFVGRPGSVGEWEMEMKDSIQSLIHRPMTTAAGKLKKPVEKKDLPEDWAENLSRNVEGFREEFLWAPVEPEDEVETFVVSQQEGVSHDETVIFIHGLAQTYHDSPLPSQLGARFPTIKWVMPQAPLKPVSVRNDTTHAWFDMLAFPYDNALDEDPANLFLSTRQINQVINRERSILIEKLRQKGGLDRLSWEERKGYTFVEGDGEEVEDGEIGTVGERKWAMKRIILSGFSQGSVMTILAGLTTREELAGIVLLSSYLPLRKTMGTLMQGLERQDLPVFWGHGQQDIYLVHEDALLSIELMRATKPSPDGLGGLGLQNLEFHSYPGLEHSWWPGEMDHLAEWLKKVLPDKKGSALKPIPLR